MFYKRILKPVLFQFSPEATHGLFINFGEFLGRWRLFKYMTEAVYGYRGPDISKIVDGVKYKTPVLLSAGFDCNGRLTDILPHLSFGGAEIGSITARPCEGNAGRTLTRLPGTKSIIVNKGLKNDGVEKVIERLKQHWKDKKDFVIGVSIAKTNDKVSADTDSAIADYAESFRKLNEEAVGDYYAINISCPNAYGGEAFTSPLLLEKLIAKLSEIKYKKPVYVKMPINLPWPEFLELLKILDRSFVKGVIIGNLNKDYSCIKGRDYRPEKYEGGLSGKPCFMPSNELIRRTRESFGRRFTIIGTGGIFSAEDAIVKFRSGADLVGLITGMIYEGPALIKEICRGYAEFADRKTLDFRAGSGRMCRL